MTYRVLHTNDFWIPLSTLVVITMMGCNSQENAELVIDQRSYNLGEGNAFGEMVDAGVKKLVLSAELSPEDMDALIEEAARIGKRNNIEIDRKN